MNYIDADEEGRAYSLSCEYPYTKMPVLICECGALVHAELTEDHDAFHEGLS